MNMKKTLKTLATLAAVFGLAFAAEAKNYTTVFSQDFEDSETYTENMSGGSVTNTLFGTSTSSSGSLPGTPTQSHRTVVGSATGSNFYSIYSTWKNGNLLFTIPDAVTNAVAASQDYIVEFDYYLNFITTSTYSGLAIQGANGPIATFYAEPGSKSGESTGGKLYLGDTTDTELITQVKGYKREADPSSSNCDKYWMHVTIKGVNTESDPTKNGIYMTVVRNNMTTPATLLAETRICDYDVVTHLFQRFSTGNTYSKYVSLDDVLVKTAVAAKTFTWTGADDNRWENAANWTVGGEATEFYPGAEDTVVIALENQQIAVSPNVAFGTFQTLADSTTFTVLFSEAGQTFTIPTEKIAAGKFSVAQPFTDSTELSGNVYTAGARAAATYTWIGGDGAWNDATQWRINDAVTAVYPTTGDTASFAAAANGAVVALASGITISGATIAEGATITYEGSAGEVGLAGNVEGAGTLVLSNVTWKTTSAQKTVYIGVAIDVPSDSTALFEIIGDGYGFDVTNKFTGAGTIEAKSTTSSNTNTGLHLKGDGSEFSGEVKMYSHVSQQRDSHSLKAISSSSNAVWRIYVDTDTDKQISAVFTADKNATYYFGSLAARLRRLKNTVPGTASGVTLEIGARNENSYITAAMGQNASSFGENNTVNWIAPTATYTNDAPNLALLKLSGGGNAVITTNGVPTAIQFANNGGTLKTKIEGDDKIDPSARFADSTAAICFDDEGEDYTWATVIADSNEGGLTKKGAGTLTIKKVALNGALQVLGGKIAVDEALTGDVQTLLSWDKVDGAEEVTLDDFSLAAASVGLGYAIVTNGTKVSLELVRTPASFTYAGGAEGFWTTANSWKIGETTVAFCPTAGDTATIGANVTLTTPVGQSVATLAIGAGSTLKFDLTDVTTYNEPVTLITVSGGAGALTADNITLTGYSSDAYKAVVSVGATAVTVTLYDKTRFVWTGTAGDRLFDTAGNWVWGASGGPVAESAPTETSTLTIGANQTVIVKQNQGFGTVTADATTTFAVLFTADAQTFTAPDGYAGKVSALGPFTVTDTAPYTATRVASANFTWAGASGGNWATASNWTVGGNPTGVAPGATDNAIFDDDADGKTIQFNANAQIATNFFGNARVQFSNDFEFRVDISTNLAGKTGTMVLADTVHLRSGSAAGTGCYYVDIEVPEDEEAYIEFTDKNIQPKVYGAICGKGMLYLKNNTSDNYVGPHIYGDMSEFEGTVEVVQKNKNNYTRNDTKLHDGDGDGWFYASNAVWNVYNTEIAAILEEGVNYSFGTLNGTLYQGDYKNNKDYVKAGLIEVGALNTYCELNGGLGETPIRKIGSATFACGAKHIGNVEIVEGTYKLLNNTQSGTVTFSGGTFEIDTDIKATIDFAKKFVNSTAAMIVDIGTSNRTWATAIPASNVGGFTKKGTATLTLEESPLYSGKTTVDAGTLVLPKGTELNGALSVTGGKIGLDGDYSGFAETLLTWTHDAELSEVTTNDFAIESPVSPLSLAIVTNETKVSLVVVRSAQTYTYVGADFGEWNTAANWKLGEDVATVVPNAADDVVIGDGKRVIIATNRTAFGVVTLKDGAKLAIAFTENGTYTPTPALGENAFVAIGPFEMTYSGGMFTATRVPSTFTWVGADGEWSEVAHWNVGDGPTAVVPERTDDAVFPNTLSDLTVSFPSDGLASNVTIDANIAFRSTAVVSYDATHIRGNKLTLHGNLQGDGLLTVTNMILRPELSTCTNAVNTFVAPGAISIFYVWDVLASMTGDLSGTGELISHETQGAGTKFYGNNTEFGGILRVICKTGVDHRSKTYFNNRYATSSKAAYYLRAYNDNPGDNYMIGSDDSVYYFGALNGRAAVGWEKPTFVIGGRNEDCSWHGHTRGEEKKVYISVIKIGTARMTYERGSDPLGDLTISNGVANVELLPRKSIVFAGGTLQVGTNGTEVADAQLLDPSAIIKDSSSAISFDDQGTNATWETALAASNVGGFTKKGAGTLTLAEAPAYKGVTRVDAGTLALPDETTKVAWDAASAGALTGGTITNVAFVAGEISTNVATEATTVREYEFAVDCTQLTVDLTAKTDWTAGATYYVVTPAGVVAGTSIVQPASAKLLLPAAQQGKWKFSEVTLASGKKALALAPVASRPRRGVVMFLK